MAREFEDKNRRLKTVSCILNCVRLLFYTVVLSTSFALLQMHTYVHMLLCNGVFRLMCLYTVQFM